MKNNKLSALSDEKLIKNRNVLKGAAIGLGGVFIIALGVILYLLATKGFKSIPIATLIPIFIMPTTLAPLFINLSSMNKEIKARNL